MKTIHKTIGQVAKQTGLTPFVIRAWEKRYGLTTPIRTKSNRRQYTEADVNRLCLLARLTRAGYSIGQLAGHSMDELEELVEEHAPVKGISEFSLGTQSSRELVDQAVQHVGNMDNGALQSLLHQVNMQLTKPHLLNDFITPLLHKVGDLWESGDLRVANEHMCAACVRSFLSGLLMNHTVPEKARKLVACTPQGQEHEIGALAAALTAKMNGWNVCYLGSDLPPEEVAASAVQLHSAAVLMSISYPTPDIMQFQILRQLLPDIPLIVGGRVVEQLREPLQERDYIILQSLEELPQALQNLF